MSKVNLEELRKLSLNELLEKYSLEELEKILPLEEILGKFPDVKEDSEGGEPGVALSDEVSRYVKTFKLICPFNPNNLRAASYELTVGNEYALGGEKARLYDEPDKNTIKIPAFQVAIIKTKEIINMPRFLIGRWNVRVAKAYEGLLWVGGPQVDPGWVGHLFCPIYNLSDKEVVLEKGESLARIDFIRTTTFRKDKKDEIKLFPRPPQRKTINDYNWRLKSGLFTEVGQKIKNVESRMNEVESEVNRFGTRLDTSIAIIFAAIAILVAALSIFVTSSQVIHVTLPWWIYLSVGLSVVALGFAIFAYTRVRSRK